MHRITLYCHWNIQLCCASIIRVGRCVCVFFLSIHIIFMKKLSLHGIKAWPSFVKLSAFFCVVLRFAPLDKGRPPHLKCNRLQCDNHIFYRLCRVFKWTWYPSPSQWFTWIQLLCHYFKHKTATNQQRQSKRQTSYLTCGNQSVMQKTSVNIETHVPYLYEWHWTRSMRMQIKLSVSLICPHVTQPSRCSLRNIPRCVFFCF